MSLGIWVQYVNYWVRNTNNEIRNLIVKQQDSLYINNITSAREEKCQIFEEEVSLEENLSIEA